MRTVFVTGGSGFVGGALLDALAERGETVRALARSPAAAATVEALTAGMRGAELVVHAAAVLRGGWPDLAAMQRSNVDGSRAVLQAARAAGVSRLVLVSTDLLQEGEDLHP